MARDEYHFCFQALLVSKDQAGVGRRIWLWLCLLPWLWLCLWLWLWLWL